MLNKLIISFLAISLIVVPAATSAALKIKADATVDGLPMGAMHADLLISTAEGSLKSAAENEKCHQIEETECCEEECGCCLAQFFPVSANIISVISFSQPGNLFQPAGLPDPQADRLIRPPRYI